MYLDESLDSSIVAMTQSATAAACSKGAVVPACADALPAEVMVLQTAVAASAQQHRCGEQRQETSMLPRAGSSATARGGCRGDAGMDGSCSADELCDEAGALVGRSEGMPAVETSRDEPTSPSGEVTATAAAAPRAGLAVATDTATAEASPSVWDLDSVDFDEEDHDAGSKEGGGRETEPALPRYERGEEPHEQQQQQQQPEEAPDKMDRAAASQEQERATAPTAVKQPTAQRNVGVGADDKLARGSAVECVVPAVAVVTAVPPCDRARELMPPPPPNITRAKMRRRRSRVTLMHSPR